MGLTKTLPRQLVNQEFFVTGRAMVRALTRFVQRLSHLASHPTVAKIYGDRAKIYGTSPQIFVTVSSSSFGC